MDAGDYRVTKMVFGKKKIQIKPSSSSMNTLRDIPLETYEYLVNGKLTLEWIMERYSVTVDQRHLERPKRLVGGSALHTPRVA